MNDFPYSPNKIFHHTGWLDSIRAGEFPAPIFVEVIPTNRCNHSCDFCAYRSKGYTSSQLFNPADEIPHEKLAKIVEDCADMGVKAIEVTGGGEPMLHPWFLDFCRLILSKGIDLGLVTNGSRWTKEATEVMKDAAWVRFSIDAGREETYTQIRHCSPITYPIIRQAIQDLSQARGASPTPIIGVGFVVTKANWTEVVDAAAKAKADGADNIRISAVFQSEGVAYFTDFLQQAKALCREAETLNCKTFRVFNLFDDRIEDLQSQAPDYINCYFQQASTYIGADQRVYRCCVISYNSLGCLGSIQDKTFKDLWQSQLLQERIERFDARNCSCCMFNTKNKTIQYALEQNPLHVNFI